jgi:pimeloyl-ACP methyl ester carboxylesterase
MESLKKKLVVIVPGSKTKESHMPLLRQLLEKFYAHFGVQVEGYEWLPPLQENFATIPADVIIFNWSGGISPFAIRRAAKELERILLRHSDREIFLFTKSLGGAVASKAAQNAHLHIKRFIYVAAPHFRFSKQVPSSIQVVNVFSTADTYQRLANRALYLGLGRTHLPQAQNIELPNLRHSDFNHNLEIEYGGKKQRLFDLYRELLG